MPVPTGCTVSIESEFTAFAHGRCMLGIEKRAQMLLQDILDLKWKPSTAELEHRLQEIRERYLVHLEKINGLVDKDRASEYYECAKRIEIIFGDCKVKVKGCDLMKTAYPSRKSSLYFNGGVFDWMKFRLDFEESVVNNPSLDEAQKLDAFRVCVSKQLREHTRNELFDDNWNTLCEKFDKLAVHFHIDALFRLKHLNPNMNLKGIQKFLKDCDKHVDALENLGYPLGPLSEVILGHILKLRTPVSVRRKLEKLGVSKTWTDVKSSLTNMANTASFLKPATGGKLECFYCRGEHFVRQCKGFLQLPFKERFELVAVKKAICTICFSVYHQARKCPCMLTCKRCQRKHNTALHPEDNDKEKLQLLDKMTV